MVIPTMSTATLTVRPPAVKPHPVPLPPPSSSSLSHTFTTPTHQPLHHRSPISSTAPQLQCFWQPRSNEGVTYLGDSEGTVHFCFNFPSASSVSIASVSVRTAKDTQQSLPATLLSPAFSLAKRHDGLWFGSACYPPGLRSVVVLVDGNPMMTPYLPMGCCYPLPHVNYIDVPPSTETRCHYAMRDAIERGSVAHDYPRSYTLDATEELLIYLPPSYHKADSATKCYPVLYLLHDDEKHAMNCLHLGKVNILADNLIADGNMTEMIIVMRGEATLGAGELSALSVSDQLCDDLTEDVIPYVDTHYRTKADRDNRAIAGLSMGSMQASRLCMMRQDLFAYTGIFSGFLRCNWGRLNIPDDHIDIVRQNPEAFQIAMKVFFRCMGDEDTYRAVFEEDDALLAELGVTCERRIYSGPHSWQVWRQAAADFLPMIFK